MISDPSDSFENRLSEWIAYLPNELEDDDALGLWQIIPGLRISFGLEGDKLEQAVRESLHLLLARGAKPVESCAADHCWYVITRFGDTANEIVDGIITEWHLSGRDPEVEDPWFALPDIYTERR